MYFLPVYVGICMYHSAVYYYKIEGYQDLTVFNIRSRRKKGEELPFSLPRITVNKDWK